MELADKKNLVVQRVDQWVENFDPKIVDPNNPLHDALARYWVEFDKKYQGQTNYDQLKLAAKGDLKTELTKQMSVGTETGGKFSEIQDAYEGKQSGGPLDGLLKLLGGIGPFLGGAFQMAVNLFALAVSWIPGVGDWVTNAITPGDQKEKDAEKSAAGAANMKSKFMVQGVSFEVNAQDRLLVANTFKSEFLTDGQQAASSAPTAVASQKLTDFAQLDTDGSGSLSAEELRVLDKKSGLDQKGDNKITRDEIPEALKAQFEELLRKKADPQGQAPDSIDLGQLASPVPLTDFKPQQAATAAK